MSEKRGVRITILIPPSIYEKILARKEMKGYTTISETIRDILREALLDN